MRAASLTAWAHAAFGDAIKISTSQTLEDTHRVYGFGVGLYNFIQRRAPWLHHVYFNYLEIAGMHRNARRIWGAERFRERVRAAQPDRVVSVHAHTNHGFFELVRETARAQGRAAPACVTYCGELFAGYGFSRHWVNARADGFVGATAEVCAAAQAVGLPAERAQAGGFLLRTSFYQPEAERAVEADALARELGLRRDVFTLLVSTGLAGANNHPEILRALAASGEEPMQVIMLCAQRADTQARLQAMALAHPRLTVRALSSVEPERMVALQTLASAMVARPGTGATSEAIQLGVPLIHNGIGGVMPQELITVQYCRHRGCGLLARTPGEIAAAARRLLRSPEQTDAMRRAMTAARPAGRPEDIVRWIAALEPASV